MKIKIEGGGKSRYVTLQDGEPNPVEDVRSYAPISNMLTDESLKQHYNEVRDSLFQSLNSEMGGDQLSISTATQDEIIRIISTNKENSKAIFDKKVFDLTDISTGGISDSKKLGLDNFEFYDYGGSMFMITATPTLKQINKNIFKLTKNGVTGWGKLTKTPKSNLFPRFKFEKNGVVYYLDEEAFIPPFASPAGDWVWHGSETDSFDLYSLFRIYCSTAIGEYFTIDMTNGNVLLKNNFFSQAMSRESKFNMDDSGYSWGKVFIVKDNKPVLEAVFDMSAKDNTLQDCSGTIFYCKVYDKKNIGSDNKYEVYWERGGNGLYELGSDGSQVFTTADGERLRIGTSAPTRVSTSSTLPQFIRADFGKFKNKLYRYFVHQPNGPISFESFYILQFDEGDRNRVILNFDWYSSLTDYGKQPGQLVYNVNDIYRVPEENEYGPSYFQLPTLSASVHYATASEMTWSVIFPNNQNVDLTSPFYEEFEIPADSNVLTYMLKYSKQLKSFRDANSRRVSKVSYRFYLLSNIYEGNLALDITYDFSTGRIVGKFDPMQNTINGHSLMFSLSCIVLSDIYNIEF